jgi:AcrR family transcriptional regulator
MSASPDPAVQLPAHPGQRGEARPGLRERKKARTRAAIREHAFRLFREQGYDATTVEQIAEAAEVSPSTFFRYFPTKEDVVLLDDMDLLWLEAVRAQPPDLSPVAALRAGMRDAFASIPAAELEQVREGMRLALTVPAVRARSLDELARTIGIIGAGLAERSGRDPADPAVRVFAGAVVGVAMAAWITIGAGDLANLAEKDDLADFAAKFDEALALLEAGLPL